MADISDDEIIIENIYLSPDSVSNRFGGEDLCERSMILRRNRGQTVPLEEYNEDFINHKVNNDIIQNNGNDFEIKSIIQSVLDIKENSSQNSEESSDSESIEELFEDNELAANWTPNVLSKPKEEEFNESTYSSMPHYWDDSLFSCLAFNSLTVDPYESTQKAFSFYKSFLDRLKRLCCKDVRLELQMWPSIVKNISICCVSGPKSGKTHSYLVPIMNWFDSQETKDTKEDIKLGSIVICSSARKTYEIARQAKLWRDPDVPQMEQTVRIVSMNSTNYEKKLTEILNGCDILITTPKPLLRAIECSVVEKSVILDTRSFIIDDADVTLALHLNTIHEIYLNYAKMKKSAKRFVQNNGKTSNPMAFQTMIFGEKWTQDMEYFCRTIQHKPNIVFGSYYEISIAMDVKCEVEVIDNENCRERTIKTLVKRAFKSGSKRLAIVCQNESEISYLKHHLRQEMASKSNFEVTEKTPHFELENSRKIWNKYGGLLFITDAAIRIVGGFQSCYAIIHYKLPVDFEANFGERFRLMKTHFKKCKNPFERENLPKLVNYVVVSPSDEQIPQIIDYLKRLDISVPQKLISLSNYDRRPLCNNFCSFGECLLGSKYCPKRHLLNAFDKPLPDLPQNGQMKIIVTYVMGANQFYFRLQEFRNETNASGIWQKRAVTYEDIRQELNALKDSPYNTVKNVSEAEVYGIAVRGEVLRVRLVRDMGEEEIQFYEEYDPNDRSQKIELFCIDFGHKLRSRSRQLFELPVHLKKLPPFAFKAYLFGIKPIDDEIEWDFNSTQKLCDFVDNYRITQITVWVLKQIDGVFWLNQMKVEKRLKNAKLKVDSNPINYLIDKKFVEKNSIKIKDFNTANNRIINIWHNYRLNSSVYHSHLIDDMTQVVVSDFVSLNDFYLIQESRVKRLQHLEEKWLSLMPSLQPLTELIVEQSCFYRGTDPESREEYINRAKVVSFEDNLVNVFLVDHGETLLKVDKNNLFAISESHIQELPFQAMKVSLFGVKAVKPITYDMMCDLTRNQHNEYLMSIAEKISYSKGIHTIRLFVAQDVCETHYISLSKLLVDRNYAEYVDGEEDNELEMFVEKPIDDPNEEFEEYHEHLEDYMKDLMCKDVLQQLGIDEHTIKSMTEPEASTSAHESIASKTKRRLKAIKARSNGLNVDNDSSDESDDEKKPVCRQIPHHSGDFDYEVDPEKGIYFVDPDDHIDDNCEFSDEDGILEEDELRIN